jgi:hypothetical protein
VSNGTDDNNDGDNLSDLAAAVNSNKEVSHNRVHF